MHADADAIVLGCVKGKLHGRYRAADLYTSSLWARRRAYAEAAGQPWYVLSAKHGLLSPDDDVDWYNLSMRDLTPAARRAKGEAAAVQVGATARRTFRSNDRRIHAGALYVGAIRPAIKQRDGLVTLPFTRLGIGEQLRWYIEHR